MDGEYRECAGRQEGAGERMNSGRWIRSATDEALCVGVCEPIRG
jgi:hypothetical protein